ncbi:MAG: winged helix-turn-helix domain-containing protein, partial [Myxococcota bacterium]
MAQHTENTRISVGHWIFDPDLRALADSEGETRLEPKVSALLLLLVESAGRPVSREEVCAALWPDTSVNDASLARVVSKLRRALGDSTKSPTFVETIYGGGYRLLVPAAPVSAQEPTTQSLSRAALGAIGVVVLLTASVSWFLVSRTPAVDPRLDRADDLYIRMTESDNASAAMLYE